MSKKRSRWVHAGQQFEADVYVDVETGRVKHVGTTLTDGNAPKVYDGYPKRRGYIAGKIIQGILGTTRRE